MQQRWKRRIITLFLLIMESSGGHWHSYTLKKDLRQRALVGIYTCGNIVDSSKIIELSKESQIGVLTGQAIPSPA